MNDIVGVALEYCSWVCKKCDKSEAEKKQLILKADYNNI